MALAITWVVALMGRGFGLEMGETRNFSGLRPAQWQAQAHRGSSRLRATISACWNPLKTGRRRAKP
jgi:hypothetical protein